ncbi:MAG TPA: LacI family transcriptional regulator [Candidatus Acetatifactor stercoripullorum]|uniref:LacI family transcriptional regulator n=1 Tax=Candidatus Acetatifactor stercoripullorum TaxID=2838414 RepID=A0A9D1R5D0_9FIRM|nr:LacI family DNA-binding transcriptional regulator [Candidatus Acetatifactor stercoripullorum]HIW80813.1 LacI family transcriptional regulator [Candidatus Acetatifactor stercoripullorum]
MVSIKEVAKHAGVAISTVSKVLNGYPNISEETKKKVQDAIKELNYIPNSIASALSSKQFGRVAVILDPKKQTQAIDQIFMQYLLGALDKAKELNLEALTVFTSMLAGMSAEEITRYFLSQSVAGVIIYGLSREDKVFQKLIDDRQFSCVVIDAPVINERTTCVGIDHEQAQYDVAKKTILGDNCKRVLYIAGKKDGYVTKQRLNGMKRLAQELSLSMLVRPGNFSELAARNITLKYAKNKDVVVCASDLMAIGAMNALIDMDIFRPVCGFDGITLMGYVGKQMNTVKQDFYSISSRAVEEVKRLMDGEAGRQVVMPHSIVKMYYKDIIR